MIETVFKSYLVNPRVKHDTAHISTHPCFEFTLIQSQMIQDVEG